MSEQYPVTVAVRGPDGSVEQVRVGTATRTSEGFSLKLGELTIGSTPERASSYGASSAAPQRAPSGGGGGGGLNFPNYGRSKGAPISGATMQDLEYYANGCRRTLADPAKARWHDKERELLAAIEAEIARQGGGGGGGGQDSYAQYQQTRQPGQPRWNPGGGGGGGGGYGDNEPPPPTDEDIPF